MVVVAHASIQPSAMMIQSTDARFTHRAMFRSGRPKQYTKPFSLTCSPLSQYQPYLLEQMTGTAVLGFV